MPALVLSFFKWSELWLNSLLFHKITPYCYCSVSIAFGVCFGLIVIQIRLDSQLLVSVMVIAWNPTAVGRICSSRFTEFFDICRITLLSFEYVFHVLLLAFRRVILPCFWLKIHPCVSVHCTVTGTTRPSIIIRLLLSLAPNHTA